MVLNAVAVFGATPRIRDIDIQVNLAPDGSATIREVWDMDVVQGTESYLNRENLGDIVISDLQVSDETGIVYRNIGGWDSSRSREAKAGQCGIINKYNGVELCWGVGEYGHRVYTVRYRMSNVVKSMDDYDMLHIQFISDELSSPPEHAKVTVIAPVQIDTTNARVWGFGYEGTTSFDDGCIIAESSRKFGYSSSLILLCRFDKGIFKSESVRDGLFEDYIERVMDGADFGDDEEDLSIGESIGVFLATCILFYVTLILPFTKMVRSIFNRGTVSNRQKKKLLGASPKDILWSREIPFDGNLAECYYLFKDLLGEIDSSANLSSAVILKLIYEGKLKADKNLKGDVELECLDEKDSSYDFVGQFYNLVFDASKKDQVLQKGEFSEWAKKNTSSIERWLKQAKEEGRDRLILDGVLNRSGKITDDGRKKAQQAYGFKKFLNDFTLLDERSTPEVVLWRQYLVYASLFGIADKVAKELKEINPDMFQQLVPYGSGSVDTFQTLEMVNYLRRNIILAQKLSEQEAARSYSAGTHTTGSWGGYGGHSSFGGGGGFSGGGHGGGVR